ncbi:MAG: carboxypeptidase regulatory-like domain-containing protein [Thermoguttaceae bacterium]|nr:carboxypeptidase regulatory-like domain-containing protein [Thermoguttaceae bacterium]
MKKFAVILFVCCLSVAALGCGKKGLSGLSGASGVITLDGQPVEGASITLWPEGNGRSAGAVSDAKGVFTFQTLNANDGVADGTYKVTVTKMSVENAYSDEEAKKFSEAGGKSHKQVFGDRPEPKSVNALPQKYAKPDTSGLTLTISGASKDLKLELTSN